MDNGKRAGAAASGTFAAGCPDIARPPLGCASGVPGGARTRGPRIKSPVLYQLSYKHRKPPLESNQPCLHTCAALQIALRRSYKSRYVSIPVNLTHIRPEKPETGLWILWPPTACGGSTRKGRKEPFSLTRQPKVGMGPCVREAPPTGSAANWCSGTDLNRLLAASIGCCSPC